MEQINTIDKISAVYRNTAEEARQELNKEEFYKLKYCSTVVYMVPRA